MADGLGEPAFSLEPDASLPGSTHGMFRVIANDGFLTGSDDSEPVYQLPNRPPQVIIFGPAEGLVFPLNSVVNLVGSATDEEDGPIGADQLVWSSDLDGEIGEGPSLQVRTLSPGSHTLSLTAMDSNGNSSSSQVHVAIDPSVVRWLPGEKEQAALAKVLDAAGGPVEPPEAPARSSVSALAGPAVLGGLALLAAAGAGLIIVGLRRRAGR